MTDSDFTELVSAVFTFAEMWDNTPVEIVDEGGETKASGYRLDDGSIMVSWTREYFEPDQRSEDPIVSLYGNEKDAELASQGTVVDVEEDDP